MQVWQDVQNRVHVMRAYACSGRVMLNRSLRADSKLCRKTGDAKV